MNELLPCPFCGGEAEMLTAESMHGGNLYGVMCANCAGRSDVYDTEAEAIEAWNSRVKTVILTGITTVTDSPQITYVPERTCRIVKTSSDSDYVDDWRYRCSECGCNIPVNERDPKTGDVIDAANYCPNCGARVIGDDA